MAGSARYDRVGLILDPATQIVAFDFDGCRDPISGSINADVQADIDLLDSYTENSPSGTGVRVLARGTLPPGRRRKGKREAYDRDRYVSVTGHVIGGRDRINERTQEIAAWHVAHFGQAATPPTSTNSSAVAPDDRDLLTRCLGNPKFVALHERGDSSDYGNDDSAADLAYCCHVARHGGSRAQADDLYRHSAICRAKWDERRGESTYGAGTLDRAFDGSVRPLDAPPCGPMPHDAGDAASSDPDPGDGDPCGDLRAKYAAALATIETQGSTIETLRRRVASSDEQLAILRNPDLGSSRATAAALAQEFRARAPVPADRLPPQLKERRACYRVPLPRLADYANVSNDTVSRQTLTLASFTTDAGSPVLFREVIDVPGSVSAETGEIVNPHRELWIGPGPDLDPATWGGVVAKLSPAQRKAWGGKADRNACPDHPHAGIVRRIQTIERTRTECAVCHRSVGGAEPDVIVAQRFDPATPPIRHDAAWAPTPPMPQDAASTYTPPPTWPNTYPASCGIGARPSPPTPDGPALARVLARSMATMIAPTPSVAGESPYQDETRSTTPTTLGFTSTDQRACVGCGAPLPPDRRYQCTQCTAASAYRVAAP